MTGVPHLQAVEPESLPDYPVELIDARMTSDYFTMFWHDRWLNSELHLTADMAVQGAALNLFFIARKQNPVGSLPENDRMIAKLLHIDIEAWERLKSQPINPLHNWSRFRVDDKIVLGHPVVIEVAMDALARREQRAASNEERAVAMRQHRLKRDMKELRCSEAMCNDPVLVQRLDDWLVEHHPGQRRMPKFAKSLRRALDHAHAQGWIGRSSY